MHRERPRWEGRSGRQRAVPPSLSKPEVARNERNVRMTTTYLPHFCSCMDIALDAEQNGAVVPQKGALLPSATASQLCGLSPNDADNSHGVARPSTGVGFGARGLCHSYCPGRRRGVWNGGAEADNRIVAIWRGEICCCSMTMTGKFDKRWGFAGTCSTTQCFFSSNFM